MMVMVIVVVVLVVVGEGTFYKHWVRICIWGNTDKRMVSGHHLGMNRWTKCEEKTSNLEELIVLLIGSLQLFLFTVCQLACSVDCAMCYTRWPVYTRPARMDENLLQDWWHDTQFCYARISYVYAPTVVLGISWIVKIWVDWNNWT